MLGKSVLLRHNGRRNPAHYYSAFYLQFPKCVKKSEQIQRHSKKVRLELIRLR